MGVSAGQLSLLDPNEQPTPKPAPLRAPELRETPRRQRRQETTEGDSGRQPESLPPALALLTVTEVARLTGLSANAVYRAVWSGELRASKLRGRLRVRADEIDAWVDAARVRTARAERKRPPRPTRARPLGPGRGLRELLKP